MYFFFPHKATEPLLALIIFLRQRFLTSQGRGFDSNRGVQGSGSLVHCNESVAPVCPGEEVELNGNVLNLPVLTVFSGHEIKIITKRTISLIQAAELSLLCRVFGLSLRGEIIQGRGQLRCFRHLRWLSASILTFSKLIPLTEEGPELTGGIQPGVLVTFKWRVDWKLHFKELKSWNCFSCHVPSPSPSIQNMSSILLKGHVLLWKRTQLYIDFMINKH